MSGSSVCQDCGATIPNGIRGRYQDPLCADCHEKWLLVFKNPVRPQMHYRWECGCETKTYRDTTAKVSGKKRNVRCCPHCRGARLVEKRAVCPVCGKSEIIAPRSNQWLRCRRCQGFVDIVRRREWKRKNVIDRKYVALTAVRVDDKKQIRIPEIWRDFSPFGPVPVLYLVPEAARDITSMEVARCSARCAASG